MSKGPAAVSPGGAASLNGGPEQDSAENRRSSEPPRHPMAEAVEWVAQVTAVPLTMGLLGWVGYKLDQWLGTSWLALVGVLLGLVFGMVHLLMKVSAAGKRGRRSGDQDSSSRH